MKKALILFLIVLVLFSIPLIPHCANQFNISTYMVLDGLPTDIIKTIIQDQTGDVWIGTDQGLVHYNGVRMKVYHDELPSLYIKDVIIIDNQNIVVVTDMGCVLIEINELGYTFHDFLGGDTEQKEGLLQYPKKGMKIVSINYGSANRKQWFVTKTEISSDLYSIQPIGQTVSIIRFIQLKIKIIIYTHFHKMELSFNGTHPKKSSPRLISYRRQM
jgi:hypothetical protein